MPKLPPICNQCKHEKTCDILCPGVDIIANGNIPCRELIVEPGSLYGDGCTNEDYKTILDKLQHNKYDEIARQDIESIPDHRQRTIIAMRWAGLSYTDIEAILPLSRRQIIRIAMSPVKKYTINQTITIKTTIYTEKE